MCSVPSITSPLFWLVYFTYDRPRGLPPYWYPVNLAVEILASHDKAGNDYVTNSCFSIWLLLEFDDTGSTRTAVGLVLDLGTRHLADCGEQLNKILVAGGPREVANVDQVAGFTP